MRRQMYAFSKLKETLTRSFNLEVFPIKLHLFSYLQVHVHVVASVLSKNTVCSKFENR